MARRLRRKASFHLVYLMAFPTMKSKPKSCSLAIYKRMSVAIANSTKYSPRPELRVKIVLVTGEKTSRDK